MPGNNKNLGKILGLLDEKIKEAILYPKNRKILKKSNQEKGKMEFTWMTLVFRVPTIILGILIGYFAYRLYQLTKGGSRGWIILTVMGICLFFWATTAMVFAIVDIPILRYLAGIIFLLGMAVTLPTGFARLAQDFGVKMPKWLNLTSVLGVVAVAFFGLLIGNVVTGNFDTPVVTLLTISHLTLGIAALIGIIPTYLLSKATNQNPWKLALVFAILIGVGLNVGQYYNNCCHEDGIIPGEPICAGYDLDYNQVYAAPCVNGMVMIGQYYQITLLLGIIVLITSLYQLTSRLKFN